ncbi:hypothetical protein J0656_17335 [Muricauda ruestringensis]|uniref:Toxin YqcG C-terminal domain-containing protein n=1 Tax=Flagellimonas aurea TaxID=2915619 RepID=A0ABS3G8P8_9FLAO|nr:GH-E family nuclease [Allomuricauda aurea]MBO0355785.1 hypothetical protein [Allomuricauda aurea]
MRNLNLLIALFFVSCYAQAQSDTNLLVETNATASLNLCGTSETLTVTITNSSSQTATGVTFTSDLPTGISVLSSQYTNTGTSNVPIFTIPDISGNSMVNFTYEITGECSLLTAFQGTIGDATGFDISNQNTISYSLDNGPGINFSGNSESYNVRFAELEVKVADNDVNQFTGVLEKDIDGTVLTREVEVRNSGLGNLSEYTFYLDLDNRIVHNELSVETSSGTQVVTPSSTMISPIDPNFNRYIYIFDDFSLIGNNDQFFGQNEVMVFTDKVSLFPGTCQSALETNYTANWGCNGSVCNDGDQENRSIAYVSFIAGRPSLRFSYGSTPSGETIDSGTLCGDQGIYEFNMINDGTGSAIPDSDTAYNIIYRETQGLASSYSINGVIFPDADPSPTSYRANVEDSPLLTTDPDGSGVGFEDVDKDGFYDDLPVGNILNIQIITNFVWDPNNFDVTFKSLTSQRIYYSNNNCSPLNYSNNTDDLRYSFSLRNSPTAEIPEELSTNQTTIFKFNVDGYSPSISPDNSALLFGEYYSDFHLPDGYVISGARWSQNLSVPLTVTQIGDIYRVFGGNYSGYYELDVSVNCPGNAAPEIDNVVWNMYLDACGNYDTLEPIAFASVTSSIFTSYDGCSSGGGTCDFVTDSFNVDRNTFGYVDPVPDANEVKYYTNNQLQTATRTTKNDLGVALDVSYPLDNVLISSEGTLLANQTNPGTYTTLFFEFAYNKPNSDESGLLVHQTDGTLSIGGNNYILSNPQISYSGERVTYTYTISGVSVSNATEQPITVSDLELQFVSKSETGLSRGKHKLSVFRGKFYGQKSNGDLGCANSKGTDFSLLIPQLEPQDFVFDLTCDLTLNTGYFIIGAPVGGVDDFPNEYRPLLIYDKLTVQPPENYQIKDGFPFTIYESSSQQIVSDSDRTPTLENDPGTVGVDFTFDNHIAPDYGETNYDLYRVTRMAFEPVCDENYEIPANGSSIGERFSLSFIDPLEGPNPQIIENTSGRRFYVDPSFDISPNATQEGYERFVSWPVLFCNEATSSIGSSMSGSWIALELKSDDTRTRLVGATDESGNDLEVVYYGGMDADSARGMLVKVGTISRSNCVTVFPKVTYVDCQNDAVQNIDLLSSWSCGDYPLEGLDQTELASIGSLKNPGVLSCQYRLDEQELTLRYKTGGLTWEVNRLDDNVDLCDALTYEVKVLSSRYANVYDTELTVTLPPGISQEDIANIQYAYDGQTGLVNVANFIEDNTPSSNNFKIKVSELVTDLLVTAGVAGIEAGDNTIPGSRLPGKNEITFSIDLVSDCTMDPGIPVRFDLNGVTNCNDEVNLFFNRLFPINGVVLPDMTVDVAASDFLVCNTQNQVDITLDNNDSNTLDDQEVRLTLPAGVSYGGTVGGTPEPVQSGNVLIWSVDDINTNKTQSFSIFTTLTDFNEISFDYVVDVLQSGQAVCVDDQQACNLQVTTAQDIDNAGQITLPEATINPVVSTPVCEDAPIVLTVELEGVSDYSGFDFNWNTTPESQNENQFTFRLSSSTNLEVNVSPIGNNNPACTTTVSYMAEVYPGATIAMSLVEGVTCTGEADGKVQVIVNGETGTGYTEQQPFEIISTSHPGLVTIGQTVDSGEVLTVQNLPLGPFSITFRDNYGCTFEETLNVPLIDNPIINFCTSILPCDSGSGDVSMNFDSMDAHSAINGTTYNGAVVDNQTGLSVLDFTGTFADFQSHTLTNVMDNTSYTLEITAANGCVYTRPFMIESYSVTANVVNDNNDPSYYQLCFANETRDIVVGIDDNVPFCSGFSVPDYEVLFGTVDENGDYVGTPQSFAGITDEIAFNGLGVGNYKVTVRPSGVTGYPDDISLCEEIITFNITSRANFVASLETKDPLCAGGASGSAEVIINGGSGSFTYEWKQQGSGDIISNGYHATGLGAGDYEVVVTDANGCPNAIPLTFSIVDPAPLETPFIEDVQTACEAIAGSASGTSAIGYSSGVAPYTFRWYEILTTTDFEDNPVTNESFVYQESVPDGGVSTYPGITPGDYKVTVTDANGCTVESLVTTVTQPDVARQYNINLSWSSQVIQENENADPRTFEIDPIGPSNFRQALAAMVERCIQEAQEVSMASVANLLKDVEQLQDTVSLAYTNSSDVYHYTLYYYDRAGNLVRTVPPEGVNLATNGSGEIDRIPTNHTHVTGYDYNSISQLGRQSTPDGGETRFLYNDIGQLLYSQNDRQSSGNVFSYSIYDELGRIVEAGEAQLAGKTFPDDFLANGQADESVASSILLEEKMEYIRTTFNEKAEIAYRGEEQRFLRNRVSQIYNLDKNGQESHTYYSYDPHGNVEWIVQHLPGVGQTTVAYSYDLISGNVNEVVFNLGKVDEYHHQYSYDEDNRIISVRTSKDGHLWDEDARYDYYLHGPLARTELGEDRIQGLDFTYTIHGWLKGINTPDLAQSAYNPDGPNTVGDPADTHAKDEFGMALGYYSGDFARDGVFDTRLTANNPFVLENQINAIPQDLYNGNISTWVSQTAGEARDKAVSSYLVGNAYQYDQLNRIKEATTKAFNEGNQTFEDINGQANSFRTAYTYDGNGNLQTLQRYKDDGQLMDDLLYHYDLTDPNKSNKLTYVDDGVGQISTEINDLPDQNSGNYLYDAIGQLIRDESEGLSYVWNTSGKVSEIIPDDTGNPATQKVHMKFTYDGMGNRIVKQVNRLPYVAGSGPQINDPEAMETTYYSLDAQGNVMGIYKREDVKVFPGDAEDTSYRAVYSIIERPMYGSDRIGQDVHVAEVYSSVYDFTDDADYDSVIMEFVESINSVALENVLIAQNVDEELTDDEDNTVIVPGTNLATAMVDGEFVELTYNANLIQGGNSTPVSTANNIFVIEDAQGGSLGYGVVSSGYFSNTTDQGVMLIYGANGELIPGLGLINADTADPVDYGAKSVVVKHPGRNDTYYLFYRDTSGDLNTATLSTASGNLEVTAVSARSFSNYGRHMAVVEDRKEQQAYVFATMHTDAVLDGSGNVTTPPQATLVRFALDATGTITEEGAVLTAFDSYDTLGNGELQVALDGSALSMYNYTGLPTQWTEMAQAEVRTWQFNENWLPMEGSVQQVAIDGNIGKGSLLHTGEEIYYTQHVQESNGEQAKMVVRASNGEVVGTQIGDLRANGNHKFYTFMEGTDSGSEYNLAATNVVNLNNLPTSSNGTTGYQPYQSFVVNGVTPPAAQGVVYRNVGEKQYELKDHLGNVRVVVGDRKNLDTATDALSADVIAYNNYYPFGMQQPNRNFDSQEYRYGFNGKEKDDELKGQGHHYDYGFRVYDSRGGRFLSQDPLFKSYPWYTPYQFAGNTPIQAIDLDGLEEYYYWDDMAKKVGKTTIEIVPYVYKNLNDGRPDLGQYGFYKKESDVLEAVSHAQRLIEAKSARESKIASLESYREYQRLSNPLWLTFEFSPLGTAASLTNNIHNEEYGWAALDAGLGLLELRLLAKSKAFKSIKSNTLSFSRLPIASYSAVDANNLGQAIERIYKSRNRPSFRKGVVDEVWKNAQKGKPNGKVYDPNTGELLMWDKSKSRNGQWDMGHLPQEKWDKLRQQYIDGDISWEQVLERYNDPKNYRPEAPSSNRSGKNDIQKEDYR